MRASSRGAPSKRRSLDFGPLEPRFSEIISTPDKKLHLIPKLFADERQRLLRVMEESTASAQQYTANNPSTDGHSGFNGRRQFLMVGRRHLHSNNPWMHNSKRLVKSPPRCTLLMHPEDASARELEDGEMVCVRSRVGELVVPLELSDVMMKDVVSLSHGWGHRYNDTKIAVAQAHTGWSSNEPTDDTLIDEASGTTSLNGVPVWVAKV